MDIKAITWFQIDKSLDQQPEQIESMLATRKCRACPGNETETLGWVSPFGEESEVLLHSVSDYWLFSSQKESRLLPATVINDVVAEKVAIIEQAENRKVSKKERSRIKDEAMFTLLPKAFIKKTKTNLYIDTKNQLLAVCSSSKSQVDQTITLLRNTLGSLKVTPIATQVDPNSLMSDWLLSDDLPDGLALGNDCEMANLAKEQGSIKFNNQGLQEDSILRHLHEGKTIAQLSFNWQGIVSFNLSKDLVFTKIKWLELDLEAGPLDSSQDKAQALDASFILMTGIITNILTTIVTAAKGYKNIENTQPANLEVVV